MPPRSKPRAGVRDSEREVERRKKGSDDIEPVILTRHLADVIDGIDITGRAVGARLPLSRLDARMLLAEGWAVPVPPEQRRSDKDE